MKRINIVYIANIVLVALVVVGVLPRSIVPYLTIALSVYFVLVPLEEGILYFVRSIPLFIAIPLTASFDSLNMWRIFSIILFLKWLTPEHIKNFFHFNKQRKIYLTLLILLALAVLSVTQAASWTLAVKRIIYFINISLVGIIIHDFVARGDEFKKKLVRNIAIPAILVAIVGFIQQASTYFLNIDQFFWFWGGTVERNLFGNTWADIALKANTWFAYFGEQISLRMFSVFPDSHSFPIFLVLGLPAILAISLDNIFTRPVVKLPDAAEPLKNHWKFYYRARGRMFILFVPMALLGVILSGTRGMWMAGVGSFLAILALILATRHIRPLSIESAKKALLKYLASYFGVFVILFAVAYPIIASPQFNMFKLGGGMLGNRVRSIINLGETSNSRRIEIWKDSLRSIVHRPILGVGINNFPVVVGEDLAKVKAGSSAHNLYLHIAAEIGIPALLVALYFLWLLLRKTFDNFRHENDPLLLIFFSASLIFIPWNLIYSLTDIAIFDERAFLLFVTTIALIFGKLSPKYSKELVPSIPEG